MSKSIKVKALPPISDKQYQNPLPVQSDADLQAFPDPYVMKYNGEYYCYSTAGGGVPVSHSKDMINWKHLGFALVMPGQKSFWAPCAIYHNGLFYMYYSCMGKDSTDVHTQSLKVAVSSKPEGPFEHVKTFYNHFSIDPHVVRDEQGEFWMYYTVSRFAGIDSSKPGTVNVVDRMPDLLTLEGNPQPVIAPTIKEEIFEKNRFGDGRDWYCVEGSFHLKRGAKEYVMFSGNAYTHEDYFIGYAVKSSEGKWEKYPDAHTYHPVLRRSDVVEGTGHHSVAFAPNNVDQWVVYHGRNVVSDGRKGERRNMRMDPLLWAGDRMWVPGPTADQQDAPNMPSFRDLFDGADGSSLCGEWRVISGEWVQEAGAAVQGSVATQAAAITAAEYSSYMLEVNLKAHETFMGAQYGVYAQYRDSRNHIAVVLDAGKRSLTVYEKVNGVKWGESSVQLEEGFDFGVYHELVVVKTGRFIQVSVDGLLRASASFQQNNGAVGMFSHNTKVSIDSFSVTEHLELTKENAQEFAAMLDVQEADSRWELKDGQLLCGNLDTSSRSEIFLRDLQPESFQLTVDLDLKLCVKDGAAGLYTLYQSADHHAKAWVDLSAQQAAFEIVVNGEAAAKAEIELSAEFFKHAVHTFYVKKSNGKLVVLLDDRLLYSGDAHLNEGRFGLLSNGKNGFAGIRLTKI